MSETSSARISIGARLGHAVRRFFRMFGLTLVMLMGAFLINHHLLRPFAPTRDGALQAASPDTLDPDRTKKIVVCFGFADLERGVTTLHPSQSGRVDKILIKENETVPAGTALLHLEDRVARLRVEEAKALLAEATVRLAKAEKGPEQHQLKLAEQAAAIRSARYRLAAATHSLAGRQERLRGETIGRIRADPTTTEEVASTAQRVKEYEEAVNQEEKKLAHLRLQTPALELERVQADVATMRARLLQAEQTLEEHTLKAPESGTVLRIFVTESELLTMPPKRMAIQFCPNRPRVIRAEVEQSYAAHLEVGLPALVEDDALSGKTWRGHVMRVSDWYTERRQIADEHLQLKDVRTLECLIALDPGQPQLRISQRVRVTIRRPDP